MSPRLSHQALVHRATESVLAAQPAADADPLRPAFHFGPPAYWINDPNGPIYHAGRYHLFYQHNPYAPRWATMHWGHASSPDLVHWHHEPVALAPGPEDYDADGVYSGCCVVHEATPTILYTGVKPEVQCLATSDQAMRTWHKHPANPVIASPPRGDLTGFRDPFAWREGDEWRMALGSGVRGQGGCALLYASADLVRWRYLGPLCTGPARHWECPNFFPLANRHVLMVSPHGPVRYALGDYEDDRFRPGRWRRLALDGPMYAPNTLLDARGRRILFGWIHADAGTRAPWTGYLTLPVVLDARRGGGLRLTPLPELAALHGPALHTGENLPLDPRSGNPLDGVLGDTIEIDLLVDPADAEAGVLEVLRPSEASSSRGAGDSARCGVAITYDARRGRLSCAERSGRFRLLKDENLLHLRVFVDRSVVEVYANERAWLVAPVLPAEPGAGGLQLRARGGGMHVHTLRVWPIAPARSSSTFGNAGGT